MKKFYATAAAACAMLLAATACSSDEEPEPAAEEATETATAADEAATESESEAEGASVPGACDDDLVTTVMSDLVSSTGVEFAADNSYGGTLSCEWNDGSPEGPTLVLDISSSPDTGITEEILDSLGQEVIDDGRFSEVGAIPAIVLGCENGTAATIVGCGITVYGNEAGFDIIVQALVAPDLTQDQLVDAAWIAYEAVAG